MAMLHKKELADHNINISLAVEPDSICVRIDKTLIEQVLINLIKNAIQAFGEKQDKNIFLKSYTNEQGSVVISVKDTGTGIEPEALEKIFIPFFSTKKNGSGIGFMRESETHNRAIAKDACGASLVCEHRPVSRHLRRSPAPGEPFAVFL